MKKEYLVMVLVDQVQQEVQISAEDVVEATIKAEKLIKENPVYEDAEVDIMHAHPLKQEV